MSPERKVFVDGPNPSSNEKLIGSLIYKCGLDLDLIQRLEKNGKKLFSEIPPFFRQEDLPLSFESRTARCVVVDGIEEADIIFYLFEADGSTEEAVEFIRRNKSSVENSEHTRLILLLDFMDRAEWSESVFEAFASLADKHLYSSRSAIIPISAGHGDNILEESTKSPWYYQQSRLVKSVQACTLIEAIDR